MSALPKLMTKEEVFAHVSRVLVDSFDLGAAQLRPDAHLIDDLDLDSIDAIDLVVSLEEVTGLDVSEEELKSIRVVQDIVDLVHRKQSETRVP
jgi:acyl carrier protein